ncbi:hypothetical protein [uncultured Microbulbifer sp.]|uniref:SCO family protein n=1 Tax=uncultured Microbulbifer sp. TaxID=348147 RepID=UPI00260FE5CB|nr:hypothetical protein [uncultured Microbulbifer sp.]
MTEHTQTQTAPIGSDVGRGEQTKSRGLGRLSGFIVFASVALPIVAAYIVFYTGVGIPTATVNQGELLKPAQQVAEMDLIERGGKPIILAEEEPRWRYLILSDAQCAEACEKLLYTTRQVHIRLSDKAPRVERLLVTSDALAEARHSHLAGLHPLLRFATADQQQVEQWLADSNYAQLPRPSALLVDQNGFAMMVYDNGHSGNQLLKDIKRLLKYSYEK